MFEGRVSGNEGLGGENATGRTRWGTDSAMHSWPPSEVDHVRPGVRAWDGGAGCVVGGTFVGGAGEDLRMPLWGAAGLDAGDEDDGGSSSMSGLRAGEGPDAGDEVASGGAKREVGTSAGRGLSLPLEAMLGVPICRDRRRPCCVSIRWKASSDVKECERWGRGRGRGEFGCEEYGEMWRRMQGVFEWSETDDEGRKARGEKDTLMR